MKAITKRILINILIMWGASLLFVLLRRFGIEDTGEFQRINPELFTPPIILMAMNLGIITGIIYSFFERWIQTERFLRMRFSRALLIGVSGYLFLIFFVLSIIFNFYLFVRGQHTWTNYFNLLFSKSTFMILLYFFVVGALVDFFKQVNQRFGPGVLLKVMNGTYFQPQEEELVLMFLDLQSSTTIAEQLGHKKYSALIRDCFNDLIAVADTKANVLQYVGDEVVFYWSLKAGTDQANCLKAYFAFDKRLQDKAAYYKEEYGIQPLFKAGANCGFVTITEVGTLKKELAFHGDTINTAARIQGLCNDLNQHLLISQQLKDKLDQVNQFQFADVGEHQIKGKEEHLRLFAVSLLD